MGARAWPRPALGVRSPTQEPLAFYLSLRLNKPDWFRGYARKGEGMPDGDSRINNRLVGSREERWVRYHDRYTEPA